MIPNPPLGVLLHAIGGLMSAIFYLPYRKVKHWSWESYWIVGGVLRAANAFSMFMPPNRRVSPQSQRDCIIQPREARATQPASRVSSFKQMAKPKWVAQATRLSRPATGRTKRERRSNVKARGKIHASPVPSGGSPLGTGQWPVLPTRLFTVILRTRFNFLSLTNL